MVDKHPHNRSLRDRLICGTAWLWRPMCVLCGAAGRAPDIDLCEACERDLPANGHACSVCAEPLQPSSTLDLTCGACLKRKPRFDAALCAYRYAYPVDHLVQALKYGGSLAPARVLASLLARRIEATAISLPSILIPVPLSEPRFRRRGYNQAIELGRHLHRRLGIVLCTDLVTRVRDTPEQAGLDRKQRRKNIRGAFTAHRRIAGAHVAILDDVVTTGSTVNELAKVLKRAGAKRVEVWAVARAGK